MLLTGELTMTSGSHEEAITAGMVVVLDRHERVEVANKGRRTASTTMRRCTSTWPGIQCA